MEDERLIGLEMKISYLERDLGELDGVVRELSDGLTALRRRVESIQRRLETPGPAAESEEDEPFV